MSGTPIALDLSKERFFMKKLGRPYDEDYKTPWEIRFDELRSKGLTYAECAVILNAEGHKTALGKPITIDKIRCRVYNRKRANE